MEGRKGVFYLKTHSTHLVTVLWHWTYVKDNSDSERGNQLAATWATLSD